MVNGIHHTGITMQPRALMVLSGKRPTGSAAIHAATSASLRDFDHMRDEYAAAAKFTADLVMVTTTSAPAYQQGRAGADGTSRTRKDATRQRAQLAQAPRP